MGQLTLFGQDEPRVDASFARGERIALEDGAWLDVVRGWLHGDAQIFELLRARVAWHGDYVARRMPQALVATVSVGEPRTFLLRKTGGGRSMALKLGWGDLLVMGGSCQRTFQHAIPKAARAGSRIAIMYRPV